MKLHDSTSAYKLVEEIQVPDNFTTTGSTLVIEWYSGSNPTSIDLLATVTALNISDLENATRGEDGYCSALKPCSHNEGDCDFDTDCDGINSACFSNGCPSELGLPIGTDCCFDLCHSFIDMGSRVLVSPNFPKNYQNNLHCTAQITVQQGLIITIEFDTFNVRKLFWSKIDITTYNYKSFFLA